MKSKPRQQKTNLYLVETEGQVRRAVKRDIEAKIKKRMKALEQDVMALQEAMRRCN